MNQIETRSKLLFATLFLLACGGAGNQSLSINASSQAFLIAYGADTVFPDGDTCYSGQTIATPRFTISKITTTWKGEGNFRPNFVKIDVNGTGNSTKYICTFTASANNDSIAIALGFTTVEINKNGQELIAADSLCSFICGSFPITNKGASLSASGTVRLYGIQTKTVNNQSVEYQISTTDSFNLQYQP